MYRQGNSITRLAKLTAFSAVFLLLIQSCSAVFVQAEEQPTTDSSVETSGGEKKSLNETVAIPVEESAIPESVIETTIKKIDGPQGPQFLTGNGTSRTIMPTEKTKSLVETDPTSGALVYSYGITLPPGRNNLSPNISLRYNSNQHVRDSYFGYKWELDIPNITRINKYGSEQLFDHNDFTSSLSGELIATSGTTYSAKVEGGDFTTYTFSDNTWIAYDKAGTKYTFGAHTSTRQDDPSDTTRIYKWMLEEVRDTNNNFIRYEYFKDSGQIYPEKIIYTGTGVTDGIFEIMFYREAFTMSPKLYSSGFMTQTSYRISTIEIRENTNWIRKYELTYANINSEGRMLLMSVQESAKDNTTAVVTTLDPTLFTYKKTTSTDMGWTKTANDQWDLPGGLFVANGGGPTLIQLRDVNGDAYPDMLYNSNSSDSDCDSRSTQINDTHGGWIAYNGCNVDWEIPIYLKNPDNLYDDYGTRVFDYNGDLLPDLVWSYTSNKGIGPVAKLVYKNSGDPETGWVIDTEITPPVGFVYYDNVHADNAVQIVDVNGDGLQDIVRSFSDDFDQNYTYLNTGNGWIQANPDEWIIPVGIITQDGGPEDTFTYAQFADMNDDGLVDIFWSDDSSPYKERTFINNGSGWLPDMSGEWTLPLLPFWAVDDLGEGLSDGGTRGVDVNGDNMVDIIHSHCVYPNCNINDLASSVWVNRGDELSSPTSFAFFEGLSVPEPFVNDNHVSWYTTVADLNADGMDDVIYALGGSSETDPYRTHLAKATPFTDLLIGIQTPTGATTDIAYKSSSQYFDATGTLLNPKLSFLVTTVATITTSDGFGNQATQSFTYADGYHYFNNPHDKKFAGFGIVTSTDPVGNVTKTYYHQGDSTNTSLGEYDDHIAKMGKPYRIETYDASGILYQLTLNTWDRHTISTDHDFVKRIKTTTLMYDGTADHKDTAVEYTYDNTNGNLLKETNYGEVTASTDGSFTDIGTDKAITTSSYATNGSGRYALSQQTLVNHAGNKVTDQKRFYDTQPFGTLTFGNNTKTRNWKTGSQWTDTLTSYNSFGLPTTTTDPLGNVTTFTYDAYNLYPATMTNALLQTTQYIYDYSSGKPTQITDTNNLVTQTVFDGLDRVIAEKIPDLTTPATLVTKTTYAYTDTAGAVAVHKTNHLDASTAVESYQYFDGLNRLIQERTEAEASTTFNTKDISYNTRGLLDKESLPYASTGSARTVAITDSTLYTTTTYDPLARPLSTTNVLGTTSYAYDQWKTTITDANNKQKILTSDAYQNLVSVEEKNAGATYTTTYKWNLAKQLTKLTDALGNVRNFTYDGLGRRVSAEDLHAPADTTFGTWTYTYDDNGNLTQSIDPNAQAVTYTYDARNRPLTENYTGTSGTDISYTYDSGTYGKGHLATATVGAIATTYTYNPHGSIASENKTIGSTPYTTSYTYDRQGNILTLTYPDLSQAKYLYSTAGYLNKIRRKESGGSFVDVVTSFSYAPTGNVKVINVANGVSTTNTYDATKLYRLTNRKTNLGSTKYQNLSYAYDPVGNIMQIVDASQTSTAKTLTFTYDDLYRLLSATATGTVAGGNFTETYSYNELGNILSKSDLGTYAYTGNTGTNYANPHAVTTIAGTTRTYDPNGNLLTDGTNTYAWNYKNQLASTTTPGGTLTYVYDHSGARQKYVTPTSTTITPNKYYEEEGTTKRRHIYAGDTLMATIEKEGTTITPYYVHADHLGSVEKMTNQVGTVTELNDFYPFGKVRYTEGNTGGDKTFLGKYHDEESGLEYLEARYYGSKHGQFTSQDPAFAVVGNPNAIKLLTSLEFTQYLSDPQAMNSYSYARNNPIKYKDDGGKYWETAFDVAMFSLSLNDFRQHPGIGTGFGLLADGASLALPVPAVIGAMRHGDDVAKFMNKADYLGNYARRGGYTMEQAKVLYNANKNFNFNQRGWSVSTVGDSSASLVGHFMTHGAEVGVKNVGDYYNKANNFISKADYKMNLGYGKTGYAADGSDNFAVINKYGEISTFSLDKVAANRVKNTKKNRR